MLNFTPIDKERFFEPNYLKKQDLQNEIEDFKKALQLYLKKRDGKGSENHKATIVGDTVGDPFKDTSGPSLNILIKLMSMVSIVMAGLTIAFL